MDAVVHVFDPGEPGKRRDFTCSIHVLTRGMRYFKNVLQKSLQTVDNPITPVEISVHCDVAVFEWLLGYCNGRLTRDDISVEGVLPLLIASNFLQMDTLVADCLSFMSAHLGAVAEHQLQLPGQGGDLTALPLELLTRLARMVSERKLEELASLAPVNARSRHMPLVNRLYKYKLEGRLRELRTTVARCAVCTGLFSLGDRAKLECPGPPPPLPRGAASASTSQRRSSSSAVHIPDAAWRLQEHLSALRAQQVPWRGIYWHVWGLVHVLYCHTCMQHIPAVELRSCTFHPQAPVFAATAAGGGGSVGALARQPAMGFYPCCGATASRGPDPRVGAASGCCAREHRLVPSGQPPGAPLPAGLTPELLATLQYCAHVITNPAALLVRDLDADVATAAPAPPPPQLRAGPAAIEVATGSAGAAAVPAAVSSPRSRHVAPLGAPATDTDGRPVPPAAQVVLSSAAAAARVAAAAAAVAAGPRRGDDGAAAFGPATAATAAALGYSLSGMTGLDSGASGTGTGTGPLGQMRLSPSLQLPLPPLASPTQSPRAQPPGVASAAASPLQITGNPQVDTRRIAAALARRLSRTGPGSSRGGGSSSGGGCGGGPVGPTGEAVTAYLMTQQQQQQQCPHERHHQQQRHHHPQPHPHVQHTRQRHHHHHHNNQHNRSQPQPQLQPQLQQPGRQRQLTHEQHQPRRPQQQPQQQQPQHHRQQPQQHHGPRPAPHDTARHSFTSLAALLQQEAQRSAADAIAATVPTPQLPPTAPHGPLATRSVPPLALGAHCDLGPAADTQRQSPPFGNAAVVGSVGSKMSPPPPPLQVGGGGVSPVGRLEDSPHHLTSPPQSPQGSRQQPAPLPGPWHAAAVADAGRGATITFAAIAGTGAARPAAAAAAASSRGRVSPNPRDDSPPQAAALRAQLQRAPSLPLPDAAATTMTTGTAIAAAADRVQLEHSGANLQYQSQRQQSYQRHRHSHHQHHHHAARAGPGSRTAHRAQPVERCVAALPPRPTGGSRQGPTHAAAAATPAPAAFGLQRRHSGGSLPRPGSYAAAPGMDLDLDLDCGGEGCGAEDEDEDGGRPREGFLRKGSGENWGGSRSLRAVGQRLGAVGGVGGSGSGGGMSASECNPLQSSVQAVLLQQRQRQRRLMAQQESSQQLSQQYPQQHQRQHQQNDQRLPPHPRQRSAGRARHTMFDASLDLSRSWAPGDDAPGTGLSPAAAAASAAAAAAEQERRALIEQYKTQKVLSPRPKDVHMIAIAELPCGSGTAGCGAGEIGSSGGTPSVVQKARWELAAVGSAALPSAALKAGTAEVGAGGVGAPGRAVTGAGHGAHAPPPHGRAYAAVAESAVLRSGGGGDAGLFVGALEEVDAPVLLPPPPPAAAAPGRAAVTMDAAADEFEEHHPPVSRGRRLRMELLYEDDNYRMDLLVRHLLACRPSHRVALGAREQKPLRGRCATALSSGRSGLPTGRPNSATAALYGTRQPRPRSRSVSHVQRLTSVYGALGGGGGYGAYARKAGGGAAPAVDGGGRDGGAAEDPPGDRGRPRYSDMDGGDWEGLQTRPVGGGAGGGCFGAGGAARHAIDIRPLSAPRTWRYT